MGAEQIEHTRVGVQQLFKNGYLVNVGHAALAKMPYKAARIVESFHGSEIGNSTVLYAAVHHAAAKAACTTCKARFCEIAFRLILDRVCLYFQAILYTDNRRIKYIGSESIQHRDVAQLD